VTLVRLEIPAAQLIPVNPIHGGISVSTVHFRDFVFQAVLFCYLQPVVTVQKNPFTTPNFHGVQNAIAQNVSF
jgi:hypothetical protein